MSRPDTGAVGDDTKVCPFCAETIKAAAIKCRFCQSDLSEAPRASAPPAAPPSPPPPPHAPPPPPGARPADAQGDVTPDSRGGGRLPRGRERAVLVGATALSLVVTLVFGVLAFSAWRGAEDLDEAAAAGRAARATVPSNLEAILSYEWSTFDEDLEAAAAVMTPSFREEYLPTVEAVRDRAQEQKRTQEASVVAVSVVSEDADEVETLVFLNRTTFTEDSRRRRILQDRANVTVVRGDGGEWLIDAITFPTA